MLRKSKRSLALLLTFMMLATLFAGVPMASAASTYSAMTAPTIVPPSAAAGTALGTIIVDVPDMMGNQALLITLPTDFDVVVPAVPVPGTDVPTVTVAKEDTAATVTIPVAANAQTNAGITWAGYADNEFRVDVGTIAAGASGVRLYITLPKVFIPDSAEGEITATITALAGQFSSGTVVVGRAASSAVEVTVIDDAAMNEAGTYNNDAAVNPSIAINFKENATGAVKAVSDTLKFKLPSGFTWNLNEVTLIRVNDGTDLIGSGEFVVTGTGDRTMLIQRTAVTSAKSIFRVSADVDVDSSTADLGDIDVTVAGQSSVSPATITVGEFVDYGVYVDVKEVKDVKAGRVDQEIGEFTIKEKAVDSLMAGRTVTLELPDGCKWATLPALTFTGGISVKSGPTRVGSDGQTVKYVFNNPAGGSKGTIKFDGAEIDVAVDFSGDIAVAIEGAGLEETVVLAKTLQAITATASANPDLKIGLKNQKAGDITITESYKEALKPGQRLTLTLPVDVEWSVLPTVEVTSGDLEINENGINKAGRVLTIPIKSDSLTPSTIQVSNVEYTIYRTVPEGTISVAVGGPAVDEVNDSAVTKAAPVNARAVFYYPPVDPASAGYATWDGELFPRNDTAAKATNGTCVTPAPGEYKANATFTIGETKYKVNGVEQTMDVAPYIKDDRTYMPIRYVAMSLGVAEQNIMWDDAAKTATLIKGDKVVQVKIGSKVMLINGININMDVAPEITNDRTMLPLRFIGQAFGADFTWDDATKTATMNL